MILLDGVIIIDRWETFRFVFLRKSTELHAHKPIIKMDGIFNTKWVRSFFFYRSHEILLREIQNVSYSIHYFSLYYIFFFLNCIKNGKVIGYRWNETRSILFQKMWILQGLIGYSLCTLYKVWSHKPSIFKPLSKFLLIHWKKGWLLDTDAIYGNLPPVRARQNGHITKNRSILTRLWPGTTVPSCGRPVKLAQTRDGEKSWLNWPV